MKRFIPKNKMQKKKQKELNSEQRITWDISPVTRKADNKTKYNRKRIRTRDDYYGADFCIYSQRRLKNICNMG